MKYRIFFKKNQKEMNKVKGFGKKWHIEDI